MSISYIAEWKKCCLWGMAGGRCEYEGCNHALYRDDMTQYEFNSAYIAHIIADKPEGPRGDKVLSEQLKSELSNLMLLCDVHHRLVDKIDIVGHPVARLQEMKQRHETRIELLTSIGADLHSHILLYGAKIGEHDSHLSFQKAADAMVPNRYPAEPRPLAIGFTGSEIKDSEPTYWSTEVEQLRRKFATLVKPLFDQKQISHLSVFAFAPMPLLIELGRLLSDIPQTDVFQLQREPAGWKWKDEPTEFSYSIAAAEGQPRKNVALVLALSANITLDRIAAVLGEDVDIWVVTHEQPGNDFLKSPKQLQAFRETMRDVFNRIKAIHGEDATLHLFPAVPVSAAVELGRVWMPKADLPFRVYDQNRATNGFTFAVEISQP